MIPKQLQDSNFRFLLVREKLKKPVEDSWNSKNNYSFDNLKLMDHLDKGFNYGIICGHGNLTIIDADSEELNKICSKEFPKTFVVQSSKPYKRHYYFFTEKPLETKSLMQDGKNVGHIRGRGAYMVCPGSVHPLGMKYSIVEDELIAYLTSNEIVSKLKGYLQSHFKREAEAPKIKGDGTFSSDVREKISIIKIAKDYGFDVKNSRSPCKFHNGNNPTALHFRDSKGWFRCWNCEVQGNIIDFLARCKEKNLSRRGLNWERN
ncbi:hypothetical protein HN865_01540 [Candidatus Woesearchaeota archaeon]|jgi:hypothetical protein|nr:hypothetical protein [Candidatus Woesearchaeota archaeon]MBT7237520.1 hypothetical protein [Candidatus Woesearchaeota archaeon]